MIFTDGACEHDEQGELVCTVGGVLFDPGAECECESFGAHVFQSMVDKWLAAGKVHPVAQTEMYAECVARLLWKKRIDGRRCLFFIDNQGDLDALIKGYSMEETMKDLFVKLENLDSEDPCLPWYCRVPSASNIADLPFAWNVEMSFSLCIRIASSYIRFVLSTPEISRSSKRKIATAEGKRGARKKYSCKAKCFLERGMLDTGEASKGSDFFGKCQKTAAKCGRTV